MVEPRLICAPIRGIYGSAKECMRILAGSYAVGGKILYGWEKLYCSRSFFDCNRVPTDHIGSSEDDAGCRRLLANGCM